QLTPRRMPSRMEIRAIPNSNRNMAPKRLQTTSILRHSCAKSANWCNSTWIAAFAAANAANSAISKDDASVSPLLISCLCVLEVLLVSQVFCSVGVVLRLSNYGDIRAGPDLNHLLFE